MTLQATFDLKVLEHTWIAFDRIAYLRPIPIIFEGCRALVKFTQIDSSRKSQALQTAPRYTGDMLNSEHPDYLAPHPTFGQC